MPACLCSCASPPAQYRLGIRPAKIIGPQPVKLWPKFASWRVEDCQLTRLSFFANASVALVAHPLVQIRDSQQRTGAIDDACHGREVGTLFATKREDALVDCEQCFVRLRL